MSVKSEDILKIGTAVVVVAEAAIKLLSSIKLLVAQNADDGEDVAKLLARIEKAQASIHELPPVEELDGCGVPDESVSG